MSHEVIGEIGVKYGRGGGRPLHLDILRPAEPSRSLRPAVIYVHGGGWLGGERTSTPNQILAEAGFVTVSISYRFSSEAIFPAQIHDVKASIRWLRANAGRYGVDPERIGIWGHSAGGHLAALAAVTGNNPDFEGEGGNPDQDSSVQAAVPISAPLEFLIDWYAVAQMPVHPEAWDCISGLMGGLPHTVPEMARLSSPYWHVHATAAPQLVIHGEMDDLVPIGQARAYVASLRRYAGIDASLIALEGVGHEAHSSLFPNQPDPSGLQARVTELFRDHLGQ
ncbi:MAG TPA: alpha/beta hydrolase [Thermomicrobiales bacterium]|nr:alpha/beta hydrolase [Thermomicrobiales bacterium]